MTQAASSAPPRVINPNQKDLTNTVEDSQVDCEIDYFTINVFFDGTWNNKNNNNLYRYANTYQEKTKIDQGTSYHREATGVEWMYKGYTKEHNNIAVYVEGTGTLDNEKDHDVSAATGYGETMGLKAKLDRAFVLISEELIKRELESAKFDVLKLNVYGFSRGSATARLFANVARREPNRFTFDRPLVKHQVQLGFIGLMDTVSSMGVSHGNDVETYEQKLDKDNELITKGAVTLTLPRAFKVIHITAQDEARTYFSLSQIQSAVNKGYGLEFSLPGCHTDIGGGLGVLEKEQNGRVVVIGRNEEVEYVTEKRNLDVNGQYEKPTDTVFNSEGKTDKANGWLIDNAITRLARQLLAKANIDAEKLAEYMVNKGYYQKHQKVSGKAPPTPYSQTDVMAEGLFLVDQSKGAQMVRTLKGYRHQVQTGFPRVPCNIMVEFTTRYHANFFGELPDVTESLVPAELSAVYDEFKRKALALDDQCVAEKKGLIADLYLDDPVQSRWLYNKYIHWAGSGLLDYQIHSDGTPERSRIEAKNKDEGGTYA